VRTHEPVHPVCDEEGVERGKSLGRGTTRGMRGTASIVFERIYGGETRMCAPFSARMMWCVGLGKTAFQDEVPRWGRCRRMVIQ
jgi:hypothetical protein